jgi:heme exporter protein B
MFRAVVAVVAKDLRLLLARSGALVQSVLFGLLLVFVLSLAAAPGERFSVQGAMAIFWLASAFAALLHCGTLFRLEEDNAALTALLLSPLPPQAIWLAKAIGGVVLLGVCQGIFLLAITVFLGMSFPSWGWLPLVAAVDVGLCLLGALLGILGGGGRDALLTVLVFPLELPLLLAGIRGGALAVAGEAGAGQWVGVAVAFDAVFLGAALVLGPYVLRGRSW